MNPFVKTASAALAGLTLTFGAAHDAKAQERGYIYEPINGATANIKCESAFPDGENPNPRFISWVDTNYFHGGQLSPTGYALMSESERQQAQQTMHALNRPLFNNAARRYDEAMDKIAVLEELIAEAHPFPKSRWDDMAEECRLAR